MKLMKIQIINNKRRINMKEKEVERLTKLKEIEEGMYNKDTQS